MSAKSKNSKTPRPADAPGDHKAAQVQADTADNAAVIDILRRALAAAAEAKATGILVILGNASGVQSNVHAPRSVRDVGVRMLGISQVACNQLMGLTMAPPPVQAPAPQAPAPKD